MTVRVLLVFAGVRGDLTADVEDLIKTEMFLTGPGISLLFTVCYNHHVLNYWSKKIEEENVRISSH